MCNVNKILFIKDKKKIYIHISIFNNGGCAHYFGTHLNYTKDSNLKHPTTDRFGLHKHRHLGAVAQ